MRQQFLGTVVTLFFLGGLLTAGAWADGSHLSFQNGYGYYLQPGPAPLGAQLYPSPRPVPPVVGYTYITYQPFAPHEFLYKHCRKYRVFHSTDHRTRVRVWWH